MNTQILIQMLLVMNISLLSAQQNTAPDADQNFSTNFKTILHDMEHQFEHVRDEVPLNKDAKSGRAYYNAHVILEGMWYITNGADIVLEPGKAVYSAEFGPYFDTEAVESKKAMLKEKLDELLAEVWKRSYSNNQWLYQMDDNRFTKNIKLYHFYGDGSGIFVKIIFECKSN